MGGLASFGRLPPANEEENATQMVSLAFRHFSLQSYVDGNLAKSTRLQNAYHA